MESNIEQQKIQQDSSFKRLMSLQLQHKQLQQTLKLKKQALILNTKLLMNQIQSSNDPELNTQQLMKTEQLIQQLFNKEEEISFFYANSLIDGQIRIEQQVELRDILKQYENRMMELRSIMIDKQIELVNELEGKRRQYLPTPQHLRLFNISLIQEQNVNKIFIEHKKLVKEMSKYQQQTNTLTKNVPPEQQVSITQNNKHVSNTKTHKRQTTSYQKQQTLYTDRLMDRIILLLKDELANQEKLDQQHQQLKSVYNQLVSQHKQLVLQYKKINRNNAQEQQYTDPNKCQNRILKNIENVKQDNQLNQKRFKRK